MSAPTVYNKIGKDYNSTRKADPYIAGRLYDLLNPEPGNTYLDIGCGTGNYTIKLAEMGLQMIGIDPSELMLHEAQIKIASLVWKPGFAENIPLPDNSVDGAIATLTIHHWTDTEKAFSELARVLKPEAKLVIFTFTPEQEACYWFNHFFPEMMRKGMQRSLPLNSIREKASKSGLEIAQTEKYFVRDDLQDMFGYSGKNDPERYFDPALINGISYFSVYADAKEKEDGLRKLRECIDNGQFQKIKEKYENDLGDYLFVILKKK